MRLRDLDLLLPDLVQRLPRLKADLLMKLLSNTEVGLVAAALHHMHEPLCLRNCDTWMAPAVQILGTKLLALKSGLPGVDIQNLASRFPMLLTDYDAAELMVKLDELRSA